MHHEQELSGCYFYDLFLGGLGSSTYPLPVSSVVQTIASPCGVFSLSRLRCLRLRLVAIAFAVGVQVNQRKFYFGTLFTEFIIALDIIKNGVGIIP